MILIVKLISRTFSQNVSKTALFELSLKKLFAELTLYTFSLKNFFVKTLVNPLFTRKVRFSKCFSKNFVVFNLTSINYVY